MGDALEPRRSEAKVGISTSKENFSAASRDTELGGLGGRERCGSESEFREIDGRSRNGLGL